MSGITPMLSRRERRERERFLMVLDAVEGVVHELRERYSRSGRARAQSAVKDAAMLDGILSGDSSADADALVRRALIRYAKHVMRTAPNATDFHEIGFALVDPTPSEIRSEGRSILRECTPEERRRRRVTRQADRDFACKLDPETSAKLMQKLSHNLHQHIH